MGQPKNINASVSGKVLTITIDLSKDLGPSASGKSLLIASTAGNVEIPGTGGAVLGLNLYRKVGR